MENKSGWVDLLRKGQQKERIGNVEEEKIAEKMA